MNAGDLPSRRLADLGLTLPAVAAPLAAYVPAVRVGNTVWTSGQLPFREGRLVASGLVGHALDAQEAADCARLCALNALAAAVSAAGDLT